MSLRTKNIIYSAVLLLAVFLVWKYRQSKQVPMIAFSGKTMGPIVYNIKYFDPEKRNLKPQVDSLLKVFNQSLSTYIPGSEVSEFNKDSAFEFQSPFFYPVLENSKKVNAMTGGAFDPTVMPLVNAWGFGPDKEMKHDSAYIDSLKQLVGFDKIRFSKQRVSKSDPRIQLDFSASAKGYGVDVVAAFLEDKGIKDLFIEIGGEVVAKGKNLYTNDIWKIGILDPDSDEINQFYTAIVGLKDRAMATSGNYFNYYIENGIKYSHTISPFTGYPIRHPLLSASVFANDCMTADALATACMVVGHEKAIEIAENHPEIDVFLVYSDAQGKRKTYASKGIASLIENVK